ncbi:MAG: Adenylosuccinate synthetase [Firmicutes bacterium ADurb.Bin080]|jgi:adenylosuccinate synthase|nr:MAG: Adenylosuccinate synthetase [Firmicutes bacterium ADurb.Bin080]
MRTAVVGINWGDEGKGRMVDLLAESYDIVVRYQGGNNAGHTVVNEKGKFILNLLPSGILRDSTINIMGPGMVIDLKHLTEEIERLKEKGVSITPDNLKISDRATICLPYHVMQDCLEEDRLKGKKFGSTRRGIGPVYGDKYMKKTLKMGDLLYDDQLKTKVSDLVEWKNLLFSAYGEKIELSSILEWLKKYSMILSPFVTNTGDILRKAEKEGKSILFEAQLGALRDVDYGILPYTTSSTTLASYAGIGSGVPELTPISVIGIVKAYSSCVGEGPFVSEMFGEDGNLLREAGGEYGAATGRPRRVGAIDIPATKYGILVQGATEIAITKLDILSCFKQIPVCTQYELEGKLISDFPYPSLLNKCQPHIEYLEGWSQDISDIRKFSDLPEAAQSYLLFLEKELGCKINYVSVGKERDQYLKMR